jgi:hypothetical protein
MCAVVRLHALMARQAARLITNPPIEIIDRLKIVAKAKVFPHLEAGVRVGRGIPHSKVSLGL